MNMRKLCEKRRYVSLICALIMTVALLSGCSKTPYDGNWSYIHDNQTVALTINGKKATVDGVECTVASEGDELKLTGKNGDSFVVGASDTKDQIVLYKFTTYEYEGQGSPDGLVGLWKSKENWSFEFTDQGTFKEDGYFPGYYTDNKDKGTFQLAYNDHFVDTECRYTIEGNKLTVEYPWPMVKTAGK